ncbi:uncharacterized protein LOC117642855 [Thrips palmi]|uniref:Uncharacterized protein LOC117642855 n=1 Tax=Thrips palmi TaxID=161013 RepID=A0A6P8YCF7_THRPL|nr:uncharacterized protein LOC117642855 [Thrips palmi]
MVLVVVTKDGGGGGAGKKFISASSVEDVVSKAKEKFQLLDEVTSSYKLCVASGEAEGLEIEEDEILMELTEARKPELLTLVLIPKDQLWTTTTHHSSGSSSADDEVTLQEPIASPQTPAPPKCPPLPMGPLLETLDPILKDLKMDPPPRNILLKKRRGAREASKYVSDFIWKRVRNYTFSTCQSYVSALFSYDDGLLKPLFHRSYVGLVHDTGFEALVTSVYNALNHLRSKSRIEAGETPRKRRAARSSRDNMADEEMVDDVESDPKHRKIDDYGCVRHNPGLKPGETSASQEQKRLALSRLSDISEGPEVEKLLMETYATQRSEIVGARPISSLKGVLSRWPHLLSHHCFYKHASHLLDKDVLDTFLTSLGHNAKDICQYLNHFWKQRVNVPPGLDKLLDQLDAAVSLERSDAPFSVVLIPLLLKYFKEDTAILFQVIKFNATDADVLAAASKSNFNPIIIVRGNSIFDAEDHQVVFLNAVVMSAPSFLEAILIYFLFYFVYGLKYPKESQVTLEFCQRTLLQINPPTGAKRDRTRRGSSTINSKLITLSNNLKLFQSTRPSF